MRKLVGLALSKADRYASVSVCGNTASSSLRKSLGTCIKNSLTLDVQVEGFHNNLMGDEENH